MASKRRLRRKACGDKVRYATAAAAMAESRRIHKRTGEFVQAYKCRYGSKRQKAHWHVGHWKAGAEW